MKNWICALTAFFITSANAETLRVLNWYDYIHPDVIAQFEQESGATVVYDVFHNVKELEDLLAGDTQYDLIVPSQFQLPALIAGGSIQPLSLEKLSQLHNLDPGLLASLAGLTQNGRYAVPYLWSSVGLLYDANALPNLAAGGQEISWRTIFGGASSPAEACGISWLNSPEEVYSLYMSLGLRALRDISSRAAVRTADELAELAAGLVNLNNDAYVDEFMAGNLCAGMAWSGDAIAVIQERPSFRFVLPVEGALRAVDTWAIPTNAAKPDLAHRFIDFMLSPAVARLNTEETGFYAPLKDDLPEMQAMRAENPQLWLNEEGRRSLYFVESLSEAQKGYVAENWPRVREAFENR